MPFKSTPDLKNDSVELAHIAARHCLLPNPDVVGLCGGAVFPTVRDQKNRLKIDDDAGLLLDDNVTPRWAIFWAHGIGQTGHPKGWTIAHVWATPKDPAAYTNLANLCVMPECLASLSDKSGPLGPYLRYHAFWVYSWHPANVAPPKRPEGFEEIKWSYFDAHNDPLSFIKHRVSNLKNQRVEKLRKLMKLNFVKDQFSGN